MSFISSPDFIAPIDVFLVNLCGKTSVHIWRSGSSWIEKIEVFVWNLLRKWTMIY